MSLVALSRASTRLDSHAVCVLICLSSLGLGGCKIFKTTCGENDRDCLGGGFGRSGEACVRNGDCAVGLECFEGVCDYSGTTKQGGKCVATAECGPGLYCSAAVKCTPIADNAQDVGGPCGTSADCKKGLACDADVSSLFESGPFGQLSEECQTMLSTPGELPASCQLPKQCVERGTKDTGALCETSSECLAGLYCYEIDDPIAMKKEKICIGSPMALDQEPISVPSWAGTKCPIDDTDAVAYFEVPRGDDTDKDFYRLPFPNDIRMKGGHVDLSKHPVPPSDTGVPVVQRFLDAAGKSLSGFATNAVIYFRFSKDFDAGGGSLTGDSLRIIDISKGSPTYDALGNIEWSPSLLNSNYICDHWMAIRRPVGEPLRPGTTYAAIVTKQVKVMGGATFARSPDLTALLSDTAPGDAALSAAHAAYAPLRAWIKDTGYDADSILNAAVFTTQRPEDVTEALRAAVQEDGAPKIKEAVVCKAGVKSPCDDGMGRGECHDENPDFTEIHGKLALPIFQKGTPPYEKPEQGGAIALDGSGNAMLQSHMDVCFALSIPKTAAPASGYPVMLYAHGTGGSFSGQMNPGGLAKDVATGATPGVLLAIDMPEHGNRRGDSTRPPEDLFFNFLNPEGARGNVLQGAADMMSLTALARTGTITAAGMTIPLDASRIMFFGHSQGATHSAIALPYEPGAQGGILSGVGGHLATSLLDKQKPVDIGSILPFVLFDANSSGKLVGGTYNPVLSIIQMFYESADPINYANHFMRDPTSAAPNGHHLFMTYGLFDSFSPEKTQEAYARAGGLPAINPITSPRLPILSAPVSGNVMLGSETRTVGMRQYDANGAVDGHFVATETAAGRADVLRFIDGIMSGTTPQIGQ